MHTAEHYGFLLDGNAHDRALLPPGAFGALEPGLAAAGLAPAQRWLHPGGLPCWSLLHALRAATAVRWRPFRVIAQDARASHAPVCCQAGCRAGRCCTRCAW